MSCKPAQIGSCQITVLKLWPAADHELYCRHESTGRLQLLHEAEDDAVKWLESTVLYSPHKMECPTCHIIGHFRGKSFHVVDCIGTDNHTQNNQEKMHRLIIFSQFPAQMLSVDREGQKCVILNMLPVQTNLIKMTKKSQWNFQPSCDTNKTRNTFCGT